MFEAGLAAPLVQGLQRDSWNDAGMHTTAANLVILFTGKAPRVSDFLLREHYPVVLSGVLRARSTDHDLRCKLLHIIKNLVVGSDDRACILVGYGELLHALISCLIGDKSNLALQERGCICLYVAAALSHEPMPPRVPGDKHTR